VTEHSPARASIREPLPTEIERVAHLFRNALITRSARLLVALRHQPIERFIAAAAWWPEGHTGHVQLACQPGVSRAEIGALLLNAVAEAARCEGMKTLENADLLAEDSDWLEVFRQGGFEPLRSERSFEVPYRTAWTRVMQLREKYQALFPSSWRTEPIRLYPPETVFELIAPHCLMPPAQVRDHWRADSFTGFELDLSCILFESDRPFGAFLLRRSSDVLYVDVQVVRESNPRLRSLGDILMLYHDAQRLAPGGPIQCIHFRSGATEHRQTSNLALRMGGRELGRRYVYSRKL